MLCAGMQPQSRSSPLLPVSPCSRLGRCSWTRLGAVGQSLSPLVRQVRQADMRCRQTPLKGPDLHEVRHARVHGRCAHCREALMRQVVVVLQHVRQHDCTGSGINIRLGICRCCFLTLRGSLRPTCCCDSVWLGKHSKGRTQRQSRSMNGMSLSLRCHAEGPFCRVALTAPCLARH